METWSYIVLIAIAGFLIPAYLNIRSIIRKWRAGGKWFDMLFGIAIWLVAVAVLIKLFIQTLA